MSTQKPTDVPAIEDWNRMLEGRVAVVTGGGDGIGGAISRLFAAQGACVEIAEIDPERAERTKADIESAGGTAHTHIVDVRKFDDVDRLASAVLDQHGRVDVLINNVGDYRPLVRFQASGPESW
jgi:NAD(P)-dependent dehydrogenase (short-subunit alcohol dehydrogenase family)